MCYKLDDSGNSNSNLEYAVRVGLATFFQKQPEWAVSEKIANLIFPKNILLVFKLRIAFFQNRISFDTSILSI